MAKLKLAASMLIFGTVGLFVEGIPLPSALIALTRAAVGTVFLLGALLVSRRRADWGAIRKNAGVLALSGVALGANWIFLFEAYRYTTIPVATLCYYMAPVFVIVLSPLVLREKLGAFGALCALCAAVGAALVSGVGAGGGNLRGAALALAAAALYCTVVLLNKFVRGLSPLETTLCQLLAAAAVMLPYTAVACPPGSLACSARTLALLAAVGVVHTGAAYLLYFSALRTTPAQTAALLSYIDPVTAVILSALVLGQRMTPVQLCGTALILGATLLHELLPRRGADGAMAEEHADRT